MVHPITVPPNAEADADNTEFYASVTLLEKTENVRTCRLMEKPNSQLRMSSPVQLTCLSEFSIFTKIGKFL